MAIIQKKEVVESMLEKGMIQIYVNATKPGVKLPLDLIGEPRVVLNLSWKFQTDMEIRDDGIYADLSFNKKVESVVLPWSSIWFIKNRTGPAYLFFDAYPLGFLENEFDVLEGEEEISPPRTRHLRLLH